MVVKFKKLLFLTIFTGILLLGNFVNAQQPLTSDTAFGGKTGETAETLAGTAGVGTSDPRLIASRIINISLGFLGIIAVAIIIYAGFLWMTAQGNMEQIDRAKKILTGGVIGLVIILSAFGIASLVLRLLFGASGGTGSGGSTGTGTGSGIGGGSVEFEINSTYPTENQTDVIRNVVITYQFNMGVSDKDLEENFKVYYLIEEDGGKEEIEVEGTRTVKGNVLEFIPNSDCADAGEEYKDRQCFDKNTNIIVRAKDGILSLSKKSLACSSLNTGWPCKLEFSVGEKIDVSPPVITKFSVGKQACANPNNAVEIEATDDTDVKLIELYVSLVGTAIAVPTSSELNSSSLTFEWDGSGFNNGDVVDLKVVVHDADSNTAEDTKQLTISDDINCDNTSHISPIIDWVNPEDGAPGNLVTIGGRYFGERDANSKVYFSCSGSADPRCSEVDGQWTIKAKLAWDINPRCTGDWTNNRIIAVIPEGVTDGPIKVEKINTEGEKLSGTSNDFDVNATVRPGLCKVDPMSQKVGEVIALHGINLGISGDAENVVFGYDDQEMRSSAVTWGSDNKTITSVTIPVIKTATTSIRVKQGLEYSNPIDFRAETSANQPLITKVDPDVGHKGDYITIYGSNFGTTRGTVQFGNQNADTDFPAECSIDDIWRNTQIIVKVPEGIVDETVDVSVKTAGGLEVTLKDGFEKESGDPNPGLCKIDPLSGPIGTEVSLYGENFGSQGEVTFYNTQTATVSNWTTSGTGADTAKASVPEGAQSGPVKVSGSNGLNFNVESCLNDNQQVIPDFCKNKDQNNAVCCTANTQKAGACAANYQACGVDPESQYAQYYFEFSTEIVRGGGDQFTAPKVIEECDRQNNQCNNQTTPSPSPWTPRWDRVLDRPLACANSIITARFDKNMDRTTLNSDNIKLFRCDDAEDDDSKGKDCDQVEITNNSIVTFDDKFNLTPNNLTVNTWYKVILNKDITSHADEGSLKMDEDYIWYFKTRENADDCKLGCIGVDPLEKTSNKPNDYIPYAVNGDAEDNACIMIDVTNSDYDFSWNSNLTNKAEIDVDEFNIPSGDYAKDNSNATALAKTIAETDPDIPVVITATETNRNKSGKGELTIRFPEFKVEEVWPTNQCTTVCVNADAGVKFSASIKSSSVNNKAGIYKCGDKECKDPTIVTNPTITEGVEASDRKKLNFDLSGALFIKDTWYKAVVNGGSGGVLSYLGKPISNTNDGDSYSWIFKTGFKYCEVERVDVLPNPGIATIIGEEIDYEATPMSVGDQCSEDGQKLRGNYNWEWKSDDIDVATVTDAVTNNSPAEVVTAIGEGAIQGVGKEAKQITNINATVSDSGDQSILNTKKGSGEFVLQCGYVNDNDCRIYNDFSGEYDPDNQNSGVGNNSCCYPRPRKILSQPNDDAKNICRNAMLEVTFNQEMEPKSLNDNIFVAFNNGSNACPGTSYLRLSDAGSRNIVKGTLRELYLSFSGWVSQQIVFKPFVWTANKIAQIPIVSNLLNNQIAWAQADDRWCVVPGRLSAANTTFKNTSGSLERIITKVSFAPSVLMPANTDHVILIKGDDDIADADDVGVVSKVGVSMNGGTTKVYNQEFKGTAITFKTLPTNAPNQGICVVDHVLMDPPAHLFKTNQDDEKDNNDNDLRSVDDNDHRFDAEAKSSDGQSITSMTGVYDWTWEWSYDNNSLDLLDIAKISTVDENPNQTKATVATSETAETFLRATATFGAIPDPDLPETMEGASKIDIFICDNPWPPYDSLGAWPYQSAFGNFEFFYCRDKGDDTTVDDLPVLDDAVIDGPVNVLKEILFTYKGKPGAPTGLKVFAGGLGDVDKDGDIGIGDALAIRQYINLVTRKQMDISRINLEVADVNLDGEITENDADLIQKYLGGFSVTTSALFNENGKTILMWDEVKDIENYNIYQSTVSNSYGRPKKWDNFTNNCEVNKSDENICYVVIESLQTNTPYYFKISSLKEVNNNYEESPLSNEVMVILPASLSQPTGLEAVLDGGSVLLTWDKSEDVNITRYKIMRGDMKNNNFYETGYKIVMGNVDNYAWGLNGDSSLVFYFKIQALGSGDLESGLSEFVMVERK